MHRFVLLLLIIMIVVVLLLTSFARRTAAARRRELEEEYERQRQEGEGADPQGFVSPFDLLFGGGWPESEHASVRLSAIDDPLPGRPQKHTFTRSVASWETLPDDGLERVEGSG